ncbi:MAG: ABC transporter permease subunit [Bifidobacteriaceae bacterium]|jgi:ABC-type transport system involved in multi-copper enzyme maturation permease subunit|nr:ABC transporter permease subunit [Bifidobacteriaceae bacterium]
MIPAITAEYRKFFSTRMWWILLACMVPYTALGVGLIAVMIHVVDDPGAPSGLLGTPYSVPAALAYVFPAIVGTMSVTGEYRHQTLTPTFLAEPRRAVVLGAKMIGSAPMGLAYGVAASLTALAVGGGLLAILGDDPGLGHASAWRDLALGAVAMMLWTLVGVGFGALVRNQVAAIVILLVFNQVLEPILRIVPLVAGRGAEVTQFLPGAAGEALAGGGGMSMFGVGSATGLMSLPAWGGALVMLAYAAVFAAIGYVASFRRDVG